MKTPKREIFEESMRVQRQERMCQKVLLTWELIFQSGGNQMKIN